MSASEKIPSVCLVGELPPPPGGMAVQAQRLTEGLRQQGHSVVNVRSNTLAHDSAWRRVKGLRGIINFCGFIARLLTAPGTDCVHIFSHSFLSFFLFTAPPVLLARLFGRRVILHYHGGAAEAFLRRWSFLALPVFRLAHHIIVPSRFLADVFQQYGLKSVEIPNVLDLTGFTYRPRTSVARHVLMARHLEPAYNVACGIRAFAHMAQNDPQARLVVAGDGSERHALATLAEKLGVSSKISFVGNIDNRQIRSLYDQADIFLNSSRVDNQPVSILEAFASGLPVVTTSVGGIPHMVSNGVDALLAPDDDDKALARCMERLISEPTLAMTLADNGHKKVIRNAWPQVYPLLAPLYRN